jgi:hypothetical protein
MIQFTPHKHQVSSRPVCRSSVVEQELLPWLGAVPEVSVGLAVGHDGAGELSVPRIQFKTNRVQHKFRICLSCGPGVFVWSRRGGDCRLLLSHVQHLTKILVGFISGSSIQIIFFF